MSRAVGTRLSSATESTRISNAIAFAPTADLAPRFKIQLERGSEDLFGNDENTFSSQGISGCSVPI
jgi:hypothetical protein